jgi:hypothetical protein
LRRAIRASESVCNFPDVGFEFVVELDVHLLEAFDESEVGDAGGKIRIVAASSSQHNFRLRAQAALLPRKIWLRS